MQVYVEQKELLSYVKNVRFVGFSVFCGSSSNSDSVFEILASVCFWEFCSCKIMSALRFKAFYDRRY